MCINSFQDHNHFEISGRIINRQKFDNNLKRKAVDDMFIPDHLKLFILKY